MSYLCLVQHVHNYFFRLSISRHLLKGDKESALLRLYQLYYHDLFNYGFRITRNEEQTRDCIHDLFLQLWSNSSLETVNEPKPYLLKALRYIIIDGFKKGTQSNVSFDELPNSIISYEDVLINKELDVQTEDKLKTALKTLTARQQEVIYLRFYNGLDYDEIAQVIGINNQSVRNIFSSAIKELRHQLVPFLLIAALL